MIRPTPPQARRRGLTIVEVLVALTILAVVLLPVIIGFQQSLIVTSQSSITAAAASIARDEMEKLKAELRRRPTSPTDDPFDMIASKPRETRNLEPADGFFEVAVDVEIATPDGPNDQGMKRAEVTVYRTGSAEPLVCLTTYLVRNGV